MDKIGPKEAADTIRAEFENEHVDPRFHHQVRFAGDVLAEMGKEQSVENTAKVMRLLGVHNIEGHAYADYPKWVKNDRGEEAVVNDEDHEAKFMARPDPMVGDVPNPEHGHVDPQSGEFHAGVKPVVYDDAKDLAAESAPVAKFDPAWDAAERARVEQEKARELEAAKAREAERKADEVRVANSAKELSDARAKAAAEAAAKASTMPPK